VQRQPEGCLAAQQPTAPNSVAACADCAASPGLSPTQTLTWALRLSTQSSCGIDDLPGAYASCEPCSCMVLQAQRGRRNPTKQLWEQANSRVSQDLPDAEAMLRDTAWSGREVCANYRTLFPKCYLHVMITTASAWHYRCVNSRLLSIEL